MNELQVWQVTLVLYLSIGTVATLFVWSELKRDLADPPDEQRGRLALIGTLMSARPVLATCILVAGGLVWPIIATPALRRAVGRFRRAHPRKT